MKNKELIELLQKEDPEAKVEFVFRGNYFSIDYIKRYKPKGYSAVELNGQPLHNMTIVY